MTPLVSCAILLVVFKNLLSSGDPIIIAQPAVPVIRRTRSQRVRHPIEYPLAGVRQKSGRKFTFLLSMDSVNCGLVYTSVSTRATEFT